MGDYHILYRIKVVHDYFGNRPCTALQCRPTPQGWAPARRRGLLFRQTAEDEWTLFSYAAPAEGDVLTMDLSLADPAFPLYTAWEGFRPSAAYVLELPASAGTIEAAVAIRQADRKRGIGSGFCTVALRLTKEMQELAEAGTPQQALLHFPAPSARWEYLFVPRPASGMDASRLVLEDTAGTVEFSAFTVQSAYGREAYRTVSESPVPMRETYGCSLRLAERGEGKRRRVFLPCVDPPQPGRLLSEEKGILRQVCYY